MAQNNGLEFKKLNKDFLEDFSSTISLSLPQLFQYCNHLNDSTISKI